MWASSTREQELAILEAAALADVSADDFFLLLNQMGLPPSSKETLIERLHAGRWRKAERPLDTLRRSVIRSELKRDLSGKSAVEMNCGINTESLGSLYHQTHTSETVRVQNADGKRVWRRGDGREDDYEPEPPRPVLRYVRKDLRLTVQPSEERKEWSLDTYETVDWEAAASRAGFDEEEAHAINLMSMGFTLYSALQQEEDEAVKKIVRAAWMRVERKGLAKLRSVLAKDELNLS